MKHDADRLEEPFWKDAYKVLLLQYKQLEYRLQLSIEQYGKAVIDVEKLLESRQYYQDKLKKMRIDYLARMKAAGLSEQDIKEFEDYWHDIFKYDPYGFDLD